jgi:ABC-type multidrug transport system fused ATPase/permease subunit
MSIELTEMTARESMTEDDLLPQAQGNAYKVQETSKESDSGASNLHAVKSEHEIVEIDVDTMKILRHEHRHEPKTALGMFSVLNPSNISCILPLIVSPKRFEPKFSLKLTRNFSCRVAAELQAREDHEALRPERELQPVDVASTNRIALTWQNVSFKVKEKTKLPDGTYPDKIILNDVSGIVRPGEVLGIMGPSG